MKVNLSFFPEEADKIISEEDFKEITKNKVLKKTFSKKNKKSDSSSSYVDKRPILEYTKTAFKLFLLLNRHTVLFLLRENSFYITESSECLDEILSTDYKWMQNKDIIRIANGRCCRNVLSSQSKKNPIDKPFDWTVVEFEEKKKSKNTYDTKSGEIKKFHAWALKVSKKVRKDKFTKIIIKKMTGIEEEIIFSDQTNAFYSINNQKNMTIDEINSNYQQQSDNKIDIDDLHFICWYMSKNTSPILETRWFQVMGMSQSGLEQVRNWLFCYYTYDIPDDRLRNHIKIFQKNNPTDYLILKTALKLIEYYERNNYFFFLFHGQKNKFMLKEKLLILKNGNLRLNY
jgi:hypothetical protein